MRKTFQKGISLLSNLAFPKLCYACEKEEPTRDNFFCMKCFYDLPLIDNPDDAMAALAGKNYFPKQVNEIDSLLYFTRKGITQHLLHQIKYHSRRDIARYLGEMLGKKINASEKTYTYLVPVPMHPAKEKQRGFNQAEEIAKGIAKQVGCVINNNLLYRSTNDTTQTNKSEKERAFVLNQSFSISMRKTINRSARLILVDDVITTGATIGACEKVLRAAGYRHISIISVAISI